jgi:protein subunit release factor A
MLQFNNSRSMMESANHLKNGTSKKLKNVLLSAMTALMFVSCGGVSPHDYQDSVEDAVKYFISSANAVADITNEYSKQANFWGRSSRYMIQAEYEQKLKEYQKMEDEIVAAYGGVSQKSYKNVLNDIRNNSGKKSYGDFATAILEHYNRLSIALSDYQKIKSSQNEKIWGFKELNTNIEFIFHYTVGNNMFMVSALDHSIERYVMNLVE